MVDNLVDLFACMADENRLKILLYLTEKKEATVGEIAKATNIYQSLASHHLSTLRRMGVVQRRREGKKSVYIVSDKITKLIEYANSL